MSNCISRRAFLKGAGASVVALGASGMLAGCKQNGSSTVVSVKVGDKVSNWNGLGVQLSSLFGVDTAPQQEGYEYLAVLVTVVNRTKDQTFTIGAQNVDAIDAAYPVPPASNVDANFHALAADTTDFVASWRRPDRRVHRHHLAVQPELPELLGLHHPAPAGQRLCPDAADGAQGLERAGSYLHAHLRGRQDPHLYHEGRRRHPRLMPRKRDEISSKTRAASCFLQNLFLQKALTFPPVSPIL